ncbi:MAG: hypothetical protein OXI74_08975 [Rhodospirillaceae bacterium]|nr:hypothetical protein [Rhodospirillaceae bacterium]
MPVRLVALGGLVVAAAVVFMWLPGWVDDQQPQEPVAEEPPPPEPPVEAGPVYTEEELEALREQADGLLAQLLNQQSQLDRRSAAEWGGDDFETYQEFGRSGDDAYLADAFWDSVAAYEQALEIGEVLLTRSIELIDAALGAAREALEAGNADVAAEQFSLVLQIEPDNAGAQAGLLRAQQLPDVLALVRQGEELEQSGDLEGAVRAYREAVALDGLWAPARSALNALEAAIRDRRFDDLMSRGLNAMAAEEFEDAHELFAQALALRPDSGEALSAQTLADQSLKLEQIALVEARALAFELRERWDDALRLYNDALETDSTLAFAQEGRTRAQYRVDLELKLQNLVDHPDLLFNDNVLRDAQLLASEAGGISPMGPRLGDQVESLDRLLTLASTPLPVQLQSDELTEVTLFRVGRLGQFLVRDLELRPGVYTVVGSRSGYRDVRMTFTVLPGQSLDPIRVECVEPI